METRKKLEQNDKHLIFERALADYNNEFVGIQHLMENSALSDDELLKKLSAIVAHQGKLSRSFEEVYPPEQYPALYQEETKTKVHILNSLSQQVNDTFERGALDRKKSMWLFQVAWTMTHTPVVQQQEKIQKKIRRKRILF